MVAYSVERRTSKICFSGEWSDDSGRNVNVQFVQSAIWPRASIKTDLPDQRSAERRAEDPIGTHAAVADTYRQGTRHRSFLLTFVDMGTKASRRVTRRWTSLSPESLSPSRKPYAISSHTPSGFDRSRCPLERDTAIPGRPSRPVRSHPDRVQVRARWRIVPTESTSSDGLDRQRRYPLDAGVHAALNRGIPDGTSHRTDRGLQPLRRGQVHSVRDARRLAWPRSPRTVRRPLSATCN